MPLPPLVRQKLLDRLDALIAEGEEGIRSRSLIKNASWLSTHNSSAYIEWGSRCASILLQVLPRKHPRYGSIGLFGDSRGWLVNAPGQLAVLKAARDDFASGFFDDLGAAIEAEVAADYMGQAEHLLNEGQSGKFDHVPAAVLSGAVLEKALRTLCKSQTPPIATTKGNGEPMTLNPLIVALKKAGVFPQTVAAQLEAWAHIRNKAAHGEFDQFSRQQVETMVSGVKHFLATYVT